MKTNLKQKTEVRELSEEKLIIIDLLKLNNFITIDEVKYYPEESVINIIKQVLNISGKESLRVINSQKR